MREGCMQRWTLCSRCCPRWASCSQVSASSDGPILFKGTTGQFPRPVEELLVWTLVGGWSIPPHNYSRMHVNCGFPSPCRDDITLQLGNPSSSLGEPQKGRGGRRLNAQKATYKSRAMVRGQTSIC